MYAFSHNYNISKKDDIAKRLYAFLILKFEPAMFNSNV